MYISQCIIYIAKFINASIILSFMRLKPAVAYHGISLPDPLIKEIKKYIKDKDGYRSVADFIKQTVRERIETKSSMEKIFDEAMKSNKFVIMKPRDDGLYEVVCNDDGLCKVERRNNKVGNLRLYKKRIPKLEQD